MAQLRIIILALLSHMDKAAIRMEIFQDPDLRESIGKAIKENRKAIYSEALKQMQRQKMEKVATMASPTRLTLHKASFEAMAAAVAHFDDRMKLNNELADIINPKLRQAEQQSYRNSEQYKEEQAFIRLVENHEKRMAKRQKEKQQIRLIEAQQNEEDKAKNASTELLKESQSKVKQLDGKTNKLQGQRVDGSSVIVPTVKEPLVLQIGQTTVQINSIQEQVKKDAPKQGLFMANKQDKAYQSPQEKKTGNAFNFTSTFKTNQEAKPQNQQSPQQKKTGDIFSCSQKSRSIFDTANIPPLSGPNIFKTSANTLKTSEDKSSFSGMSKGLLDALKINDPSKPSTSLFGPNDPNPSNLFGPSASTNNPSTNLFLIQPNKAQNQGDGRQARIFTSNKSSSNTFQHKGAGSNFGKNSSNNQRVGATFKFEADKKDPAQATLNLSAGIDSVLASKDYSSKFLKLK